MVCYVLLQAHVRMQVGFGAILGIIIGYLLGVTWLELKLPAG